MRKGPEVVQQWVNAITPAHSHHTALSIYSPNTKSAQKFLSRDLSFQSDDGSHCSSVESVLEFRKPDPEEVLIGLGFGPPQNTQYASRIPERFLQPSKVLPHIDFHKFLEEYGPKQPDQKSCPSPLAKDVPKNN